MMSSSTGLEVQLLRFLLKLILHLERGAVQEIVKMRMHKSLPISIKGSIGLDPLLVHNQGQNPPQDQYQDLNLSQDQDPGQFPGLCQDQDQTPQDPL